jgi:hypothetical protein
MFRYVLLVLLLLYAVPAKARYGRDDDPVARLGEWCERTVRSESNGHYDAKTLKRLADDLKEQMHRLDITGASANVYVDDKSALVIHVQHLYATPKVEQRAAGMAIKGRPRTVYETTTSGWQVYVSATHSNLTGRTIGLIQETKTITLTGF